MSKDYQRPTVQTIPASRIVELMGPVSCGSTRHVTKSTDPFKG